MSLNSSLNQNAQQPGRYQGGIRHETSEYRLSSSAAHVALAVKPYSVTVVTMG